MTRSRRYAFITFLITLAVMLVMAELMVRFVAPQTVMYPRYEFSPEYNTSLHPGTRILHEQPGRFRYTYAINEDGYRGPEIPVDSPRPKIVVLGDSYSLGVGVDEGMEYPAVLRRLVDGRYDVVNLGVGGWGLTQEVRRYEEFGSRFRPEIVVLQFCSNDPADGLLFPVTRWDGESFLFRPVDGGIKEINSVLGRSRIQMSQLYNFVRNQAYVLSRRMSERKAGVLEPETADAVEGGTSVSGVPSRGEAYYAELLDPFVRQLHADGIEVVMISVNHQLDGFPFIRVKVEELDAAGYMDYVEVEPWFEGVTEYASPQGHAWGDVAHEIVGRGLAAWVLSRGEEGYDD